MCGELDMKILDPLLLAGDGDAGAIDQMPGGHQLAIEIERVFG